LTLGGGPQQVGCHGGWIDPVLDLGPFRPSNAECGMRNEDSIRIVFMRLLAHHLVVGDEPH